LGKSKKDDFLKKLKGKADMAAKTGAEIGKTAVEKGPGIGRQLKKATLKSIEESIAATRKSVTSGDKNLEILKKLAELKAAGIISEQEFEAKKKEILDRI
jgi:hypothetical protein